MLVFSSDKLIQVQDLISSYGAEQSFLLYDENTFEHCDYLIKKEFPNLNGAKRIIIPAGEQYKTIESCNAIWQDLLNAQATKKSLLINVGGGVITDIGGFCAVNFKRGIDFINIPTSLLAMVDASIGGKTAVNLKYAKNQIGTFADAKCVYINPLFLDTLPRPQLRSGLSEMIKHELLYNEKALEKILLKPNSDYWITEACILKNMQYKIDVVREDYYDTGLRQALNFGHTIGHAIESYSHTRNVPILHGEAVLLGMIEELKIAENLYNCPSEIRELLEDVKTKYFPMLDFAYNLHQLMPFMEQDKKNDQVIRFSLIKKLAQPVLQVEVPIEILEHVLA